MCRRGPGQHLVRVEISDPPLSRFFLQKSSHQSLFDYRFYLHQYLLENSAGNIPRILTLSRLFRGLKHPPAGPETTVCWWCLWSASRNLSTAGFIILAGTVCPDKCAVS